MAAPIWWECSECGDQVQRPRPPARCRECGTAGVIFVPAEEPEEPRLSWLEAGMMTRPLEVEAP